jgi:peptide/nickel transport system substrate-binding protein
MFQTIRFIARLPLLLALSAFPCLPAQWGGTLRFAIRSEPKNLHPLQVTEESSETVRYLTSGVLIRVNRRTQQPEPELAESWKVSDAGRRIRFELRPRVQFSDGTPFTADDVAYTFEQLASPGLRSPSADAFSSGKGPVKITVHSPLSVSVLLPAPIAGLERLFDQISILSRNSPLKERATLGPFRIGRHQPGVFLMLERNPLYWKKDSSGKRLPYLDAIRLEIQQNRDIDLLRFRRGELHLITKMEPELFERLAAEQPQAARNAGPSLEPEQMWFNQAPASPIPDYKKAWFTSRNFRNAVSHAIRRDDLARIAFRNMATPAAGPVSQANRFWFNKDLHPRRHDPAASLRLLAQDGFRKQGAKLVDRAGHPVEFTLITNSGNKTRARMAALIQQDLAEIGIRVNLAPLDFPSLLERISRTLDYDACLLGLVNLDLDPNGQMNLWLSSGANHQWNPGQTAPSTPWEAEIDQLMRAQAAETDPSRRKAHFDRVQKIVWEQEPFIYLVYKNAISGVSPDLRGVQPVALFPQAFWNADQIQLAADLPKR